MRRRPDLLAIAFCALAIAAALLFLPGRAGWGVAAGGAVLIAVGGLFWMRSEERDTQAEIGKLLLFGLGKVELLGVAAPSLDDPTGLGAAARRFAAEQLPPREPVRYATIPRRDAQGKIERGVDGAPLPLADPFGRTLAYVWRTRDDDGPSGLLLNERLVALGYAKTTALGEGVDDDAMRAVRAARDQARRAAHGVWSACVP